MRLLIDADVQPGTSERLRALSPDLEIVDLRGDAAVDLATLSDPDVEIIVGPRAPRDRTRVPRLRWLQCRSAGVDHLAADPPWRDGLIVTNARGVFAIPMAEYVTGMLLRVHQPAQWAIDQAAHHWPIDEDTMTVIRGRTAVIVGYGSIGREVARQLAALGMRILAVKPRPEVRRDDSFRIPGTGDPDGSIPERIVGLDGLEAAAAEAHALVMTLPLTDRSRGIIGEAVLAALPSGAWVVNVSRGAVIDEPALLAALRTGRLGGAILDVFGEEPLPADSPWWDEPNVIVTPHASGVWMHYFDELVVENVRRYLAGEPLLNRVDPERGY